MSDHDIIDHKIRRAAGVNALKKIGKIVAEEQQADRESAEVIGLFTRFGWIVLLGAALLLAYLTGVI